MMFITIIIIFGLLTMLCELVRRWTHKPTINPDDYEGS